MKNKQKIKLEKRARRKARVRAKVFGTKDKPRLSVFRSLRHIYCQLIDDEKGRTLVSASDKEIVKARKQESKKAQEKEIKKYGNKEIQAFEVGKLLAEKALSKNIKKCVFDKSGYRYHGRVKAVAEGARQGGLAF